MQKRNIAAVMALSFVTLGIHTLYWLKKTRDELVARGADIPKFWILIALALANVIAFAAFFAALVIMGIQEETGTATSLSPFLVFGGLLLMFIIYAITTAIGIYWLYRYSQGVDKVTHGQTSFGLTFGLGLAFAFFGLWFIWPGIIQDGFNKVEDEPAGQPEPNSPAGAPTSPAVESPVQPSTSPAAPPQSPASPVAAAETPAKPKSQPPTAPTIN